MCVRLFSRSKSQHMLTGWMMNPQVKVMVLVIVVCGCVLLPLGAHAAGAKLTVAARYNAGAQDGEYLLVLADLFQQSHPDVEVEVVWSACLPDRATDVRAAKLLSMIAGGIAPDITYVGGQNVSQYALQGLLLPLDDYIRESRVQASDFIPPAWRQTQWNGQIYAMTIQVDPNFPLVWNKQLFGEAGLHTEHGPKTLADFEGYFRRLTRTTPEGTITHLGAAPWDFYGNTNTLFTWGWVFGGSFYDEVSGKVTAAHPGNIRALEWVRSYYERYRSFSRRDFPTCNLAMRPAIARHLSQWTANFPDIPLGIGRMIVNDDAGVANSEWLGGWTLGILRESRQPDLAWQFTRFITASAEGTTAYAHASGCIPAYLRSRVFREISHDPHKAIYLDIAQSATYIRPPMPAIIDYFEELDSCMKDVLAGKIQPAAALEAVQERVQRKNDELVRTLSP